MAIFNLENAYLYILENPTFLNSLEPSQYPKFSKRKTSLIKEVCHLEPRQTALLNRSMVKSMTFEELCQLKPEQMQWINPDQLNHLDSQQFNRPVI